MIVVTNSSYLDEVWPHSIHRFNSYFTNTNGVNLTEALKRSERKLGPVGMRSHAERGNEAPLLIVGVVVPYPNLRNGSSLTTLRITAV